MAVCGGAPPALGTVVVWSVKGFAARNNCCGPAWLARAHVPPRRAARCVITRASVLAAPHTLELQCWTESIGFQNAMKLVSAAFLLKEKEDKQFKGQEAGEEKKTKMCLTQICAQLNHATNTKKNPPCHGGLQCAPKLLNKSERIPSLPSGM